jgi:hypothetical protein
MLSRNPRLESRFSRLVARGRRTMHELCAGMVAAGAMVASESEIAALADNAALVGTYWMSYQKIASPDQRQQPPSLDRAAYQVLSLVAPFLRGPSRALLARLSQDYL